MEYTLWSENKKKQEEERRQKESENRKKDAEIKTRELFIYLDYVDTKERDEIHAKEAQKRAKV